MADKLDAYNKKRDFKKTAEPEGGKASDGERQFVIQLHYASRKHYDFRLEYDGVLVSWAVPKGPSFHPKDKRLAVRTEDHPMDYRHFEGLIPKGEYGGGTVLIWDRGTWEEQEDFEKGLKDGSIKIILHGERLQGKWALVRMKTEEKQENWLLIKEKDDLAQDKAGISEWTTSVVSGLDRKGLEEKGAEEEADAFPEDVRVPLCETAEKPPAGDAWAHEIKYDGYRMLLEKRGGAVRFISRNQNDFTESISSLAKACEAWKQDDFLLDGEVVIFNEAGKTDFQTLQQSIKGKKDAPFHFMAFDAPYLNGEDLRKAPLRERKRSSRHFWKTPPKRSPTVRMWKAADRRCGKARRSTDSKALFPRNSNPSTQADDRETGERAKSRDAMIFSWRVLHRPRIAAAGSRHCCLQRRSVTTGCMRAGQVRGFLKTNARSSIQHSRKLRGKPPC